MTRDRWSSEVAHWLLVATYVALGSWLGFLLGMAVSVFAFVLIRAGYWLAGQQRAS